MPPKIVYGKQKATTRTTTSFTNFIEAATQARRDKEAAHVAADSWRQQLELAAEQVHEDEAVIALEAGLEEVVPKKSKGRPRKTVRDRNAIETKENETGIITIREGEAIATVVGVEAASAGVRNDTAHARQGRRRKALQDRNANGEVFEATQITQTCTGQNRSAAPLGTPSRSRRNRSKAKSKSTSSQRRHHLPTPEATPEPADIYTAYVSPLLSLSFGQRIVPFEEWSSELEPHFEITKIAEASFSEVYRLSASSTTPVCNQESVLKVVALKTPPKAPLPCQSQTRAIRDRESQMAKEVAERAENDQWKSEVADVLSEAKLLQNLNHIPGFTNFRDLTLLQGRPSQSFAKACKVWNQARPRGKKSEFPDPGKKTSYNDTQLWAVIEMQDAGTDCEKIMETGSLNSIWEVWDVFWGVCLSVAKAEETCQFEHRDLHMGNICVRSPRAGGNVTDVAVKNPIRRKFRFTGLETTVIDYTLSRADILSSQSRQSTASSFCTTTSASPSDRAADLDVAYLDLDKDPALFEGDASEEYQYEIYRYMRGAALYGNPLQNEPAEPPATPRRSPRKNTHIRFDEQDTPRCSPRRTATSDAVVADPGNIWKRFHPKTNLVWTHFLLHKLLAHLDNTGSTPGQMPIKQLMSVIEGTEAPWKVKKKALKLHSILQRVSELLCPVALGKQESLGSVKELVVLALEERWLRVGDVAG
ncbi:hypothetical protein EK21DRAFT_99248 [Setomelanomma holmii]|uniref:non-specific serine/threonine protein kinase n=1 Tax=Setomelanomma holmii TaxID=210430 RepID=A0A9P4HDR8_9PLEO|nr:hypothetical protein EK21DRAFT_99248 [Setomelanomma holmii]